MILTRDVIRREIEAGRVVIEPFFADQVGPASIDLHLGDEIRVMHVGREPVPVTDEVDYRTITDERAPRSRAVGQGAGAGDRRSRLPDDYRRALARDTVSAGTRRDYPRHHSRA